jgi:enamine deaminase RidA (YjgF/YER057c/UK114 family)
MSELAKKVHPEIINPPWRDRPRGFSHGIVAPPGWRTLFVAGQTAADESGAVAEQDFIAQFDVALGRVIDVVRAAGGDAEHVTRLTVYVTDVEAYRESRRELGNVWKKHMGASYPAMALVQVSALVDREATIEIAADAVLPPLEAR